MHSTLLSTGTFLGLMMVMALFNAVEATPLPNREDYAGINAVDEEAGMRIRNPYLLELLANLEQELIARKEFLENTKRGLDLGLSRGFSGSQAAKHLMGLAAANFAGGPGRKRRSLNYPS